MLLLVEMEIKAGKPEPKVQIIWRRHWYDHCEDLDLLAGPMEALICRVSTWLLGHMGIFEIIVDSVTVIMVWLQLVPETKMVVGPGLQDLIPKNVFLFYRIISHGDNLYTMELYSMLVLLLKVMMILSMLANIYNVFVELPKTWTKLHSIRVFIQVELQLFPKCVANFLSFYRKFKCQVCRVYAGLGGSFLTSRILRNLSVKKVGKEVVVKMDTWGLQKTNFCLLLECNSGGEGGRHVCVLLRRIFPQPCGVAETFPHRFS